MKTFKTFLATFPAVCWLSIAAVVHLDVADNGDVAVDVDLKLQDLPGGIDFIEVDRAASHETKPQHTAVDGYDVTLPYEIYRGALSVIQSCTQIRTDAEDVQDDSSYVNFSNIPLAEPPMGPLRFKAPVPPRWTTQNINEGLEERVCPQYQIGWLPSATDFLECYAGAFNSLKDDWTDPIGPADYPQFDGSGINYNGNIHPSALHSLAEGF